ncbi:hypothetical protein [Roseibium marinum]|uniref:Flagellar basal body-associated protein FliL n=1 Tax=Roseibium marinum TaxID=281252 RepID=A0A2S3UQY9_9HYPH|nr:hypothetical protein [Roseibium marinum]POF30128.1 hypothetical protein CLV41_107155 [Roseibium marinum]
MTKILIAGIWMAATMLVSGYATAQYIASQKRIGVNGEANFVGLDYETLKPVNVPILFEGALQGYVVAKLVFTADAEVLRRLPVPPHPFLVDEAFRVLYSDSHLDFRNLERYDLDKFTEGLKQKTNARLGRSVIRDVLVEELNYFDQDVVMTH